MPQVSFFAGGFQETNPRINPSGNPVNDTLVILAVRTIRHNVCGEGAMEALYRSFMGHLRMRDPRLTERDSKRSLSSSLVPGVWHLDSTNADIITFHFADMIPPAESILHNFVALFILSHLLHHHWTAEGEHGVSSECVGRMLTMVYDGQRVAFGLSRPMVRPSECRC